MAGILAGLAMAVALGDWYATWKHYEKFRILTKPLTMILLIAAVWVYSPGLPFPLPVFIVGLIMGLIGDVVLMLKGNLAFIAGLTAFLLGHVCYILGLNAAPLQFSIWNLILLLPVGGMLTYFMVNIMPKVEKSMKIPVWVYALVIVTMFYSASLTLLRPQWDSSAVILVISGAFLFVLSDTLLAYDRFVARIDGVWVMITYHVAQIAIAGAVLLQYA